MSLLDLIGDAEGSPAANYLRGGRHLVKIARVSFREPTAKMPKASFRIDGQILKSTNPAHQAQVGMQGTMNLNFKFADQDLAKMRRALAAAATSKTGTQVTEKEVSAKVKTYVGEDQPLVGAIVVINAVDKPQKGDASKSFTHFELEVPAESDLDGVDL